MYKRLSLDEVLTIQTSFFERLSTLCTKNRFDHFKPFLTEFTEDAQRVYFFRENALAFTFYPLPDQGLRISDELDHLDIILTADEVNRLHSLLKDKKTMKHAKDQKSVFEDLLGRFREGGGRMFGNKPFLVYDIETVFDAKGSGQEFAIAYYLDSSTVTADQLPYQFVGKEDLPGFAKLLCEYDGWIIGFNHLSFDNPITIQQAGYDASTLENVQKKSLDPFQLIRSLIGKRMGLDAMANALLGTGKTLSSGAEGQELLEKWFQHGDQAAGEKVKLYCKNDVEITLGVFLYLLRHQGLYLDGAHRTIDEPTRLQHATYQREREAQDAPVGFF